MKICSAMEIGLAFVQLWARERRNKVRYWLKLRKKTYHLNYFRIVSEGDSQRGEEERRRWHYSLRYLMIVSLKIPSCFIFDLKMSRQHQQQWQCHCNEPSDNLRFEDEMRRNSTREKRRRFPTSRAMTFKTNWFRQKHLAF